MLLNPMQTNRVVDTRTKSKTDILFYEWIHNLSKRRQMVTETQEKFFDNRRLISAFCNKYFVREILASLASIFLFFFLKIDWLTD